MYKNVTVLFHHTPLSSSRVERGSESECVIANSGVVFVQFI